MATKGIAKQPTAAQQTKRAATGAKAASKPVAKGATAPKAKTCVRIHYDVGFENSLFLRGQGGGLNWERGKQLKNVGPSEWLWETASQFDEAEFKVLINDNHFEDGENHKLQCGSEVHYTPRFS